MNEKIKSWKFVKYVNSWQQWSSNYICSDGDAVGLYISTNEMRFELFCFSGIRSSSISMSDIEFIYLQNKIHIDEDKPFEMQCVQIADYFCNLLCEYCEE